MPNVLEQETLAACLTQLRDLNNDWPKKELFEPLTETIKRVERVLGLEPGEELS